LVVDCASATGRTTLTLADTGVGISAEHLERLARTRFTTKSGGLGLGLALARGAIERWGGRLTMTSRPGEGTTMTIELTES
jgi:signal transduction histidine kinase